MGRLRSTRDGEVERSVKAELDFHLEMQVRALIEAGHTPEDARAEALRRFGNLTRVEGEVLEIDRRRERRQRRAGLLRDVSRDVRFALRSLRKRPVFTVVGVLTLALGIGATAAVVALVDGALVRPLPFPREDQLVYVYDVQNGEGGYPASVPEFDDWVREADFLQAVMSVATNAFTLTGEGSPELLIGGVLAGDVTGTLQLRPVLGRAFTAEELASSAHVVMLDETFWRRRFGADPAVLGRSLLLNQQPYTVIGVMPRAAGALRPNNRPPLWMPMRRVEFMTRGLHFLQVIGRLHDGQSVAAAAPRADAVGAAIQSTGATRHGIALAGLRGELVGEVSGQLLILLGAVLVMLAIVCANMANLVLAQSLERAREFALRVAMGAGRARLARQVMTESAVLGVLGGAGGIAVAWSLRRGVNAVDTTAAFLAGSPFDGRVLAITLAVSLALALLFGLMPALRVARADIGVMLRSAGDARSLGGRGGLRRRRLLAGAELALCVVLLAGAGLLVRSMGRLLDQDLGFEPRGVLTFSLSLASATYDEPRRATFVSQLLERLESLPGVQRAAAVSHLPLDGGDTNGGFQIVGREFPEGEGPFSKKRLATPGYFEVLGIPLLEGRAFNPQDREGGAEVAIISELVAQRYWPGESAVGRRIRFLWGSDGEQEIVGVAGDIRHDGLADAMQGMVYVPVAQFVQPGFAVLVRTEGNPAQLAAAVRREVEALDGSLALREIRTMEQVVAGSVADRRTTMLLFSGFALLALVLATVGVYAIAAQAVAHRTNEFGLRMAIGARRTDVLRLVLREEMPVIALGLIAGLVGALAATRVLRASLFEVAPDDPATFGLAAALLAVVALLAIFVPARRATRLDPLLALRSE